MNSIYVFFFFFLLSKTRQTSNFTNTGNQYRMYFIEFVLYKFIAARAESGDKINPKYPITCYKSKSGSGALFVANIFFIRLASFSRIPL